MLYIYICVYVFTLYVYICMYIFILCVYIYIYCLYYLYVYKYTVTVYTHTSRVPFTSPSSKYFQSHRKSPIPAIIPSMRYNCG